MPSQARKLAARAGLVLLGIVLGQMVLYGASFSGTKILLPLDILTRPTTYIPLQPGQASPESHIHNRALADPVFEDEPERLFRHAELRAGRLPIWNPYQYAGVPSISFLSPFAILGALVQSPRILPWLALSLALVSGVGAYVFSRRVLQVGAWPATIAAWCYPVTGFFVLWQSSSLAHPVVWLPWLLCAVHAVVSRPTRWALPSLALATMLTLVSGHLDMAGLVLIVGGLFAVWNLFFVLRDRRQQAARRSVAVVAGLALGFMLASPELLPALAYAKTGSRFHKRTSGYEERPPIGLVSLPQLVLPHIYGTTEKDSLALLHATESNLPETPAAGFTGLIASLVLAPMALANRKRRAIATFFGAIAFLGIAWCLNVPGIVWIMRLPLVNLLSYNRFVFASSFAILGLATIGLEESSTENLRWRRYYYVPVAILAVIAAWCIFRSFIPPEAIAVTLPRTIAAGQSMDWVKDMEGVHRVQHWFVRMYLSITVVCLTALAVWILIRLRKNLPDAFPLTLGLLALAELLFFDYGRASQSDPRLYYPTLPALDEIAHSTPGRAIGYRCFPANLLQTQRFHDVRGYDGVDPERLVELLDLAAAEDSVKLVYAAVQFYVPRIESISDPDAVRLSPILDLLNVRYVITHNPEDTDYFVLINNSALPRVFVPSSAEVEIDKTSRLTKLASPLFDPRQVAYVEEQVDLNPPAQGQAKIIEDTSQRITISANMTASGLVVLADQWNSGWRAYIGNKEVPILRVDHALRGVIAPAGESTIVFRYQPSSLRLGLAVALFATLILMTNLFLRQRS